MVHEWVSSHFMAWPVGFQPRIANLAWNCEVNVKIVSVSIAYALRWGVTSIGITLLGVAHPIWDNISGTGQASVGCSH